MVKNDLQGTGKELEVLEKMNRRVEEEYVGFCDVAAGLRVFVEQLKNKNGGFDEYVEQIEGIEQQVTEFKAVISVLDKYVSMLDSEVRAAHQEHRPLQLGKTDKRIGLFF